MFFTRPAFRNLNRPIWDRRVWEVGYRGPTLPFQKATGRPDYPVTQARVNLLRERFTREWDTMKLLSVPYCSRRAEQDYMEAHGFSSLNDLRRYESEQLDAERMPGKPKRTEGSKHQVRKRANVGNLLHEHQTVEQALLPLARRSRWF
ncbi:unnamed protein product, partial [Mesorhabditis spiculigera]